MLRFRRILGAAALLGLGLLKVVLGVQQIDAARHRRVAG